MPVQIVITSPHNGAPVSINPSVQAQGTVDASCTVTAWINDGGVVQSSPPTPYNVPPGTHVQWNATIPTAGFTAGD
jgi:hypothetical protein